MRALPFRPTEAKLLLFSSLLTLLIRLFLLEQYSAKNPFYSFPILDSTVYLDWAEAIVEGRSYFPQEYHQPPGYAFFLAALFRLFGVNYFLVLICQNLILTLSALLLFFCTKSLMDNASAWTAYALFSLCGPLAFYSMKILPETLYIFLLLSSFLLLLRYSTTLKRTQLLACGLLLGSAIEVRSNGFICLLPCMVTVLTVEQTSQRKMFGLMILAAGVVACLLPVLVRNVNVAGAWTPVSSNWGENFFYANNAAATGTYSPIPEVGKNLDIQFRKVQEEASRRSGRSLTSIETQRYWFRQGLEFIRSDPWGWFKLEIRKLQKLFWAQEAFNMYSYELETRHFHPAFRWLFIGYGWIIPLFFFGLAAINRFSEALLPLGFIAAQALLLLVFWPELRFLLPIMPFLILIAGKTIHFRVRSLKNPLRRGVFAAGLLFYAFVNLMPSPGTRGKEAWYTNASSVLFRLRKTDAAIEMAKKAIEINPEYADAWVNLGAALAVAGKEEAARNAWTRALQLHPTDFTASRNMALSFEEEDPQKALNWWALALKAAAAEGQPQETLTAIEKRIAEIKKRSHATSSDNLH